MHARPQPLSTAPPGLLLHALQARDDSPAGTGWHTLFSGVASPERYCHSGHTMQGPLASGRKVPAGLRMVAGPEEGYKRRVVWIV